jgi:hypothetical protein
VSLKGSLETVGLSDVLALLAVTGKTGELQVGGGTVDGHVWFMDGQLIGSSAGRAASHLDVLFELLRLKSGTFTFEDGRGPSAPGEAVPVEELVAEANSRVAEWREIELVVPSLTAVVSMSPDAPGDEIVVRADQWRLLVATGGGVPVQVVLDALHMGEFDGCKALKELADGRMVRFEEAATVAEVPVALTPVVTEPEPEPVHMVEPEPEPVHMIEPEPEPVHVIEPEPLYSFEPVAEPVPTVEPEPLYSFEPAVAEPAYMIVPEPLSAAADTGGDYDMDSGVDLAPIGAPASSGPNLAPIGVPADLSPEPLAGSTATWPPPPLAGGTPLAPPVADATDLHPWDAPATPPVAAAAEPAPEPEPEIATKDEVAAVDNPINRGLLLKFLSSVKP